MSPARTADDVGANPHRFRLHRAGVLNVWQYDEQVFEFADGRLLLRGANGAGKSKTLEMLLPFALDGDKLRITASARHHTSLVWLMTDGYEGNRTGYVWVEFARDTEDGGREFLTCGVGIRASSSARTATSWHFSCPRQVGVDLRLEDDAGPLSKDRCRAAVAADGHFFEQARAYRHHVGRLLFGLEPTQYDELLRLLYWLRQPQVGEDIEPAKLADQLSQALPQVDDDAIRSAGDTFDELAAFGEQIDRRARAAAAIAVFAETYAAYARVVTRERGATVVATHRELARRSVAVDRARADAESVAGLSESLDQERRDTAQRLVQAQARVRELEASPEARSQQRLLDMDARARDLAEAAARATNASQRAAERCRSAGDRVAADAGALRAETTGYAGAGQRYVAAAARAGVAAPVALPGALVSAVLDDATDAAVLQSALDEHGAAVASSRPAVGELLAAVQVVDDARREAADSATRRDTEERRFAEAERRAEEEVGRREDAATVTRAVESEFGQRMDGWRSDARAVPVALPELTAANIPGIAAAAQAAAGPVLGEQRALEAAAAGARIGAERSLDLLGARRRGIEAERDPAPPEPVLGRTARDDADGAPLWRLIDFPQALVAADRAGLEAALEGAGLLDAWVRTDGALLDPGRLDVVLPVGAAVGGTTLADVLLTDVPEGSPVPPQVVRDVLGRIAVGADHASGPGPAVVARDGSWRLGPLCGRAAKPAAQYVGATARAAERARRLAEVDARIADVEESRAVASERERAARRRREDVEAWLASTPPHHELLTAWARLDERTASAERAHAEARASEEVARHARTEAAERRRWLEELAELHGLPTTADGLAARREELRALDARLVRHVDAAVPLGQRLARWAEDWAGWRSDVEQADQLRADADAQQAVAQTVASQRDTLQETVGAKVEELQRRLVATRAEIGETARRDRELQGRLGDLRERLGEARQALADDEERLREQQPLVVEAVHALGGLADVPGLLRSALEGPDHEDGSAPFELARGVAPGIKLPGKVIELARRLASLAEPPKPADTTALYAAWQDVASSDAADHEPRVVAGAGDVLAALGRDDGGEHPVVVLTDRLGAAVAHDRELLTDRERTLFEEHLIGDLGEMLRRRRLEAADLVEGMNRLLAAVTTSQGIAVRLHWQLREDVPEDARRAVTLLGQPVGALLPTERAELREALHRLIEASRAEAPEDSYAEHLARALDYRRWFAFRIRYTRPELAGRWQDLHRRSPLSQGEQKVVCYLPLFAAAAAHFTSLAGAAPHAPRFVLLDDAFPKIDVRTHPLLFGLLVSLDLDFAITSERLWGDHATVPSLAIYEALRDPAERGIAQYRHVWDGSRLQAVGP